MVALHPLQSLPQIQKQMISTSDFLQLIRTGNLRQVMEQFDRDCKTNPERVQAVVAFYEAAHKLPLHPPHASRKGTPSE